MIHQLNLNSLKLKLIYTEPTEYNFAFVNSFRFLNVKITFSCSFTGLGSIAAMIILVGTWLNNQIILYETSIKR